MNQRRTPTTSSHSRLPLLSLLALCPLFAPCARAQSLFAERPLPLPVGVQTAPADTNAPLYSVSMFAVQPPAPRQYKVHDLVTIIVDEQSKQEAEQNLKADKKWNVDANLNSIIDPMQLLELRLQAARLANLSLIDADYNSKFDGKGNYERTDRFTMKIQARVIDIKPNGVIVVEASKVIDKSGEYQSVVLSGSCRAEDITKNNTIFSSQLADLTLVSKQEGQVNDIGKKGLIPRVVDAVFAF